MVVPSAEVTACTEDPFMDYLVSMKRATHAAAPRSCGTRDADQVALGVGEVTDHEAGRRPFRPELAFAAEPLRFPQRGLHIGHPDVEDDVGRVAGAPADPTGNPGAVGGGDAVDEPVVGRLRYRLGDRGAGVKAPAEQLAEVVPQPLRVLADDLEVNDRVCHG